MNYSPALLLSLLMLTGCNGTPAATEGTTEQSGAQGSTQQDELAKQAAVPTGTEPAQ